MIAPARLAYLMIEATNLAPWRAVGAQVLGMDVSTVGDMLRFRMDAKPWRIAVTTAAYDRVDCAGWEFDDAAQLLMTVERLRQAGLKVAEGTDAECALRNVARLLRFRDPAGNGVELCLAHADQPDAPRFPRPISGFITGRLGLGHVVYSTPDIVGISRFYEDLLGFRLSDFADEPFAARFLHLNPRHHSLAFVQTPQTCVHHLMVEYAALDDVGQALDRALLEEGRVAVTLGRHSNDWVTSFYMASAAGMMIEAGWGGRAIPLSDWKATRLDDGPSLWGHERHWLSSPLRERARQLRLDAAEKGLKAPLIQ
jgi:2,3-dihydroxybiphenyl 1,2-dioxygenase